MKLGVLVDSVMSIREVVHKCALPVKKAFELSLFVREVEDKLRAYDELRVAKVRELGESKDGGMVVKDENFPEFLSYLEELKDQDVEVQIPQISVTDLGDVKIETQHLLKLDWLIK